VQKEPVPRLLENRGETVKRLLTVAALLVASAVALAQDQKQPQWEVKQVTEPFRGSTYTAFTLQGKYLTAPANGPDQIPALLLRCMPGARGHKNYKFDGKMLEAFLIVGQSVVVESDIAYDASARVTTEYRLDDGKVQTDYLYHSSSFKAISLKAPGCAECLIDNLFYGHQMPHKEGTNPQVKKVVVSIPEYLGANVVIQFDLPDVSEVAAACGVTYHK
jgi:hypothetical protein